MPARKNAQMIRVLVTGAGGSRQLVLCAHCNRRQKSITQSGLIPIRILCSGLKQMNVSNTFCF